MGKDEEIRMRTQLFLIEFENGAKMTKRLPCDSHGGITRKGEKQLHQEVDTSIKRIFCLENILTRLSESAEVSSEVFDFLANRYNL